MSAPLDLDAAAGLPFIDVTREFAASPLAVFRAWTDPELVVQWLGPAANPMTIEQWDAQSGGKYRYVRAAGGGKIAFRGTFHTVRPSELFVQTFEFEGQPDVVSLDSVRFVDLGGRTRVEQHSVFPSVAARDGMVASGSENGTREGYERLDALLARGF